MLHLLITIQNIHEFTNRLNRIIMEAARAMLHHANLPLSFWAEAASTAVYLRNRPSTSSVKKTNPYECWYKQKPDVSSFRVFGCNAFVHIPDQKRNNLQKKSEKRIWVGYLENSKGYKFYIPEKKTVLRSRDVMFLENCFNRSHPQKEAYRKDLYVDLLPASDDIDGETNEQQNVPEQQNPPHRSERVTAAPDRLGTITGEW